MPGGRYANLVRDCVVGILLSGSVLYFNYKQETLRSRVEDLEDEVYSQRGRLNSLESVVSKSDHFLPLDATLKVSMFADGNLASDSSGTIIYSGLNDFGKFDNYVLCANHGVDFGEVILQPGQVAPVLSYQVLSFDGHIESSAHPAEVVLQWADKDWALMYFETDAQMPVARVASEDKISSIDSLVDIFTVGCPLGMTPILTDGKLQEQYFFADDAVYWRVSTPVVMGNSGGGIYLSDDDELIGMLSGVALADLNPFVSIPVYHLAIMSPFVGLRQLLDDAGFSFILDDKK